MRHELDLVKEMQEAMKEDYGVELNREEAREALDGLTEFVRCFIIVADPVAIEEVK